MWTHAAVEGAPAAAAEGGPAGGGFVAAAVGGLAGAPAAAGALPRAHPSSGGDDDALVDRQRVALPAPVAWGPTFAYQNSPSPPQGLAIRLSVKDAGTVHLFAATPIAAGTPILHMIETATCKASMLDQMGRTAWWLAIELGKDRYALDKASPSPNGLAYAPLWRTIQTTNEKETKGLLEQKLCNGHVVFRLVNGDVQTGQELFLHEEIGPIVPPALPHFAAMDERINLCDAGRRPGTGAPPVKLPIAAPERARASSATPPHARITYEGGPSSDAGPLWSDGDAYAVACTRCAEKNKPCCKALARNGTSKTTNCAACARSHVRCSFISDQQFNAAAAAAAAVPVALRPRGDKRARVVDIDSGSESDANDSEESPRQPRAARAGRARAQARGRIPALDLTGEDPERDAMRALDAVERASADARRHIGQLSADAAAANSRATSNIADLERLLDQFAPQLEDLTARLSTAHAENARLRAEIELLRNRGGVPARAPPAEPAVLSIVQRARAALAAAALAVPQQLTYSAPADAAGRRV